MEILSEYDIEELACKILGLDIEDIDGDIQIIEDKMAEEYYIDLDTFRRIIERLLPLLLWEQAGGLVKGTKVLQMW